MACAATQRGMTPEPVIARRPQADEAISTAEIGDCFPSDALRTGAGARSDKIDVIGSERLFCVIVEMLLAV